MTLDPLARVTTTAATNKAAQQSSIDAAEAHRAAIYAAIDAGIPIADIAGAAGVSLSRVYTIAKARPK